MTADDRISLAGEPYDQEDADAAAEAGAEREARAKAFQAWWSGPFGDNYRNLHRKVSKAEALDAFIAGWLGYRDAMERAIEAEEWADHDDSSDA